MNRRVRLRMLSLEIALLCALPVLAADQPGAGAAGAGQAAPAKAVAKGTPAVSPPCPAIDAPAGAYRRAFVDPETGRLREPTPQETAQLAAAARAARLRTLSQLEVVVRPDGSKSVNLKDAFLVDLVALRNTDGSLSIKCLPPGSRAAAKPPAIPATPVLEEK